MKTVWFPFQALVPILESGVFQSGQFEFIERAVDIREQFLPPFVVIINNIHGRVFQLVHLRVALSTERNSETSNWGVVSLLPQVVYPVYRHVQFPLCFSVAVCTRLSHSDSTPSRTGKSQGVFAGVAQG